MAKILVVEDDLILRTTIQDTLEFDRHQVEAVGNGIDALARLSSSSYDLLVLDIHLPGRDGLEICRSYRAQGGEAPVLFLTARDTISDKEQGFMAGADDYLVKPFNVRELSLRAQALLKRIMKSDSAVIKYKELELNRKTFSVSKGGKKLSLSKMEFALLEFFMRNAGEVFSSDSLIARVWPSDSERNPETLRSAIKKLRDKIDSPGQDSLIQNVHGVGYRLE